MPYTDAVKWALDHANPEEWFFNDYISVFVASFRPKNFAKAYGLSAPKQFLSRKFLDEAASCFNYEHVVKSWMENPMLFPAEPSIATLFHG